MLGLNLTVLIKYKVLILVQGFIRRETEQTHSIWSLWVLKQRINLELAKYFKEYWIMILVYSKPVRVQ